MTCGLAEFRRFTKSQNTCLTGHDLRDRIQNMQAKLQAKLQASQDDLLSIRQAAKVLGVNRYWLSAFLEGRGIKFVALGSSLGIRRSVVEAIRLELVTKEEKAS